VRGGLLGGGERTGGFLAIRTGTWVGRIGGWVQIGWLSEKAQSGARIQECLVARAPRKYGKMRRGTARGGLSQDESWGRKKKGLAGEGRIDGGDGEVRGK